MGSFNYYVHQILPNFDSLPIRVDNCGHFTWYPLFCQLTKSGLCTAPLLLVHVVTEWPLSTTYTNLAKSHHPYVVGTYELYNLNLVRIWPQQNVVRVRLSSNMISRWHTQLAQQCSIENEIQNDQHFPSTSLFTWKVDRMP